MKAVSHTGKMQSARRRYRRRRYGGHPGERGPWFSWDSDDDFEGYDWSEDDYNYLDCDELDRGWCEIYVHVYLSWNRLLPDNLIGVPVLPDGDSLESITMADILTPTDGEAGPSREFRVPHGEDIPAVLAEYFNILRDESPDSFRLLRAYIPRILTTPEGRIFRRLARLHMFHDPECSHAGMIVSLLHWRPFWIRPLATWSHADLRGADWIESLINHLLVRFPVPKFIQREIWRWNGWFSCWALGLLTGKAAIWFILVARGVSLHRAAAHFDWVVPKGLVHWIAQAPEELSLRDATLWAEVMRLGGSPIEFERLLRCHGYRMDVTSGEVNRKGYLKTLRETIQWLIAHRDELTNETSDIILEWYAHEFTEIQAGRLGASMNGRSVQGALAVARAYVASRSRPCVNISWQRHGWDWETIEPDSTAWTVRELTTGRELGEEGMAMRHCVSGYAHGCAAGYVAIFSLQTNEKRRLTIEISLPAKAIVQVRGSCNRPATPEEMQVVQRWRSEALSPRISSGEQ